MYLKSDSGLGGWIAIPAVADVLRYSCIVCWSSREKNNVEQDLKEKEDTVKQRTSEVQVSELFCPISNVEIFIVNYFLFDEYHIRSREYLIFV